MKFRRRRSLLRLPRRVESEDVEPLKGQLWTRSERNLREPDVHWLRKAAAVTAAVGEVVLLLWLWWGPATAIRSINVIGAAHMSSEDVARIAGIQPGGSVLGVDGYSDERRLLEQIWVRKVSVQPDLTGTVTIRISEWQPIAAYQTAGSQHLFVLSNQSVVLGGVQSAGGLVVVQGPAGPDPKVGDRPLDPQLLIAMVNIQKLLPTLIGQQVSSFIFDSCGNLTLVSKRGWKAYFGRVLTPEEFASLHDKVAALKAIAGHGRVDYNSKDLMYVNVMNPDEPAVGYRSLLPVPASPSPGASPQPLPSPSPVPTPLCK